MLFIAHALPRNLQVDEVVRIGAGNLSAVVATTEDACHQENDEKDPDGKEHHESTTA